MIRARSVLLALGLAAAAAPLLAAPAHADPKQVCIVYDPDDRSAYCVEIDIPPVITGTPGR